MIVWNVVLVSEEVDASHDPDVCENDEEHVEEARACSLECWDRIQQVAVGHMVAQVPLDRLVDVVIVHQELLLKLL